MAIGVLVLGESGTGKTYSIHNFKPEEVKILSVQKPILPFRGKYDVVKTPTAEDVIEELQKTKKKYIVVDDFQYILGIPMMRRIGEKGWEKFNEIQEGYSAVLEAINDLPDDTIVFLNSHVMYNDETGRVQIKTIGKALDKYITIEGLFMIVLGTQVVDGKYYFITQNNGSNTLKSPEGMFPSLAIPNDLKYVADKILNYYYMDGAKSDEEIASEDAENTISEEEIKPVRKSRRSKKVEGADTDVEKSISPDDEPGNQGSEESTETVEEKPKRRSRNAARQEEAREQVLADMPEPGEDELVELDKNLEPVEPKRKKREEVDIDDCPGPKIEPNGGEIMEEPAPRRRRRRV